MSTTDFRTKVKGETEADTRSDRARSAVKQFRAMQPMLSKFAQMLTGRSNVQVVLAGGIPRTDGTKIYYRPPIELGDNTPHSRRYCDKRDEDKQPLCAACMVREDVMCDILHEISHIVFGSFAEPDSQDVADILDRAIDQVGSQYAATLRKRIDAAPRHTKSSYLGMAGLISPFLPLIVNALDDARIDSSMFAARRGTKVMFEANLARIAARMNKENIPLNAQILAALFIKASGYNYKGMFHPHVERTLDDPGLTALLSQVRVSSSIQGIYHLSFPVLAKLREFGYFVLPEDPDQQESDNDGKQGNSDSQVPQSESGDGNSTSDSGDDSASSQEASSPSDSGKNNPPDGNNGREGSSDPGHSRDMEVDENLHVQPEAPDERAGDPDPSQDGDLGGPEELDFPAVSDAGSDGGLDERDGSSGQDEASGSDDSGAGTENSDEPSAEGEDELDEQSSRNDSDHSDGVGDDTTDLSGGDASDGPDAASAGPDDASEPSEVGPDGTVAGGEGSSGSGTGGGPDETDHRGDGTGSPPDETSNEARCDDDATPGDRIDEDGIVGDGGDGDDSNSVGEQHGGSDDSLGGGRSGNADLSSPTQGGSGGGLTEDKSSSDPAAGSTESGEVCDPDSKGDSERADGVDGEVADQRPSDTQGTGDIDGPHQEGGQPDPSELVQSSDSSGVSNTGVPSGAPVSDLSDGSDDSNSVQSELSAKDHSTDVSESREETLEGEGQSSTGDPDDGESSSELIDNRTRDDGGITVDEDPDVPFGEYADVERNKIRIHSVEDLPSHVAGKADVSALEKAIIQGAFFESPSEKIFGVREHYFGKPIMLGDTNMSLAWNSAVEYQYLGYGANSLGIHVDLEVPESILGPALLHMRVAFDKNKRANKTRNQKSGAIDPRVLGKRAWKGNDSRLFAKKTRPGKRDYAVLIGIDCSGSTIGVNIALAKRAAMAQAELCNRLGVKFAIFAHTALAHDPDAGIYDLDLDIYVIKDFDQSWNAEPQKALQALGPAANNIDGHTVEYYRKKLERVRATDKILMYYTDGAMPASNYKEELEILQREIAVCKRKNITLMGVGIHTDSPVKHGLDTVEVAGDSDIVSVVKHLEKRLAIG